MIHPSYVELMKVVNQGVDVGDEPVINSRYSIVCATAKRARQKEEERLKAEAEAEERAAERAAEEEEDTEEEAGPVEGGLSVFASEDEDFTPHAGDDEGDDDEE